MALTIGQVATQAAERLKVGMENRLRLQSYVPNALNNLARQVANNSQRRRLLLTDRATATAAITGTQFNYYADLNTLISTPGIMLEYLEYGTIFLSYETQNITGVSTGTDTLTIVDHGYYTGLPVMLTEGGTLPAPLRDDVTYYVVVTGVNGIQLATSLANASASTPVVVDITTAGSGTNAVVPQQMQVAQWLGSPSQANLQQCVPLPYPYIWLVQDELHTNQSKGTFRFTVPFVPTLATLPAMLENDLIDEVVQIAIQKGFEPMTEAEK